MLFQIVLHQTHPLSGSKVTQLAAVAEMLLPAVLFQRWPAREGLLASPALQPWVLFTGVSSKAGSAGAQQPTVGTPQGAFSSLSRGARGRVCGLRVSAKSMLLQCCL